MKHIDYPELPESLRQLKQIAEDIEKQFDPIVESQRELTEGITSIVEQPAMIKKVVIPIDTADLSNTGSPLAKTIDSIGDSRTITGVGSFSLNTATPSYSYYPAGLNSVEIAPTTAITNFSTNLKVLLENETVRQFQTVTSAIADWLRTIDFSPLFSVLKDILVPGFERAYKSAKEIYLQAMFDARWFPCAGQITDVEMITNVPEILNTSRASKNRVKRIDKLIFSHYNKDTINALKRRWRQKNLPSYMTRILVQSIQAYHRREYALTVSVLSTLWEGIIQEKVDDTDYRVAKRTRENLSKLIEENEFDKVFSSFCEEFIFYKCHNSEEVKPDVPGRHGIAHCWYDEYPSRKMALNAILFTDFLLELKPLDQMEEADNG